ncbi:MAG TPA: DUF1365 domain-containing protein [Propionibacteriaceae bacterium]|nr:DUF1365 domain-containing protein [Propionibacteriaceae bacterium]
MSRPAPPLPSLVVGTVAHVRHQPKPYEFTHAHTSWLVDLDEPPQHSWAMRLVADLRSSDHYAGAPTFAALKASVLATLSEAGVDVSGVARVVMLAHARSFGFVFDPMTAYWALAADGSVVAVVIEVHNTFGERVAYPVLLDKRGRGRMEKSLFVSPFNDREGWYDVRLRLDADRVEVWIRLDRGEGPVVTASVAGKPVPAATDEARRALVRSALMPWRVWALIHVHALRLWRRRLPTYPLPGQQPRRDHPRPERASVAPTRIGSASHRADVENGADSHAAAHPQPTPTSPHSAPPRVADGAESHVRAPGGLGGEAPQFNTGSPPPGDLPCLSP